VRGSFLELKYCVSFYRSLAHRAQDLSNAQILVVPSSVDSANRVIWKTRETNMGPCKQVWVCVLLLSAHATGAVTAQQSDQDRSPMPPVIE
jgi:hypothetical protein